MTIEEKMQSIPKAYQAKEAESKWYRHWLEKGYFTPKGDGTRPTFTIVIPPPNVTGNLHIGHALNNTLQDILIRTKRMQGYDALWLPGMDHAGIATQARVEATLKKEENLTRHDLGRDAFVERVWSWKEHYASLIRAQWEKLGLSLDYTRERFTLDEGLSRAVREVFVRLYEKGLIYRGEYIINWDPEAQTALSDIEVIHKEIEGALYHLRYPLKDGSGYIEIATTRPETMFGDVAIAVHPDDERYQHLIGKIALLPVINRELPIIADAYVDPSFGSGAVKITPAHDPNDFEIGLRHDLPRIAAMDFSAKMTEAAGPYAGMDRFACRKKVVADLQEAGVLTRIERHVHAVGHSERTGVVVEPMLSTQWFVRMKPLAEAAIEQALKDRQALGEKEEESEGASEEFNNMVEADSISIKEANNREGVTSVEVTTGTEEVISIEEVTSTKKSRTVDHPNPDQALDVRAITTEGRTAVRFVPERFRKIYLHWIEHVRDWVISRQLWWGHRIPAWYCDDCGGITVSRETPEVCMHCKSPHIQQDEDVLDTWFSSALWPFSTLGWPDETDDFKRFYPTDVLVTGHDIIYFWVARMIFMALEFTGNNPFHTVLIHGLVRDSEGRKMSKSLGNGVDPMEMIDRYGADALRFMLSTGFTPGQDFRFRTERLDAARNFANKIWNASRFVLLSVPDETFDARDRLEEAMEKGELSDTDRWILHRLQETIVAVTSRLSRYEIGEAGRVLYDFIWDEYCDWYIEMKKTELYGEDETQKEKALAVLIVVLEHSIALLHPFMPFLTEEIYHLLPHGEHKAHPESLIIYPWPTVDERLMGPSSLEVVSEVIELVRGVRNIRQEMGVEPGRTVTLEIFADPDFMGAVEVHRPIIARLSQSDVVIKDRTRAQERARAMHAIGGVTRKTEYVLPLKGLVDVAQELDRLKKEWERWDEEVERAERKLANPDFVEKAPAQVVEKERQKLADYLERREKIRERLAMFTAALNEERKADRHEA
ncbi:MAG: Valyl-tRNA synthetase [Candidatus Carbobacillus altaicus]|uniref:Valine--tRNA ligase n=1 Tax=Candidatus Carbonibacillus altaicus TaxID=2163959 RepID=A0A2R6Y255_9BACL|nr:MAG: Valyl-tRNA synthetase [Candidatus Carbobacillus altaicus]